MEGGLAGSPVVSVKPETEDCGLCYATLFQTWSSQRFTRRREEALANLMSSQATLAANQATFQANFMALTARTDERFARIEAELAEIRAILLRHEQMLQSLPEAVRQRVGFESR